MYICIVVFFALAAGFFIVFSINPVMLVSDAINNSRQKPQTIKRKIDEARDTQQRNFIVRQFHQAKEILMMTERADQYDKYCRLAALLAIIGVAGGILLQNLLLIPVLALMGLMIPLLYIRFSANSYQKKINREVETALSIINSSYIRTENLVYSVRENIENINPPVLNVFEFFLNQVDLINPSVELALSNIRGKIKNDVFVQWCDAMIL